MSKFRCLIITLSFFAFSVVCFAQENQEKQEELAQREAKLIEQLQNDSENLKLPENRAVIFAQVGGFSCKSDQKNALPLFQKSVNELIIAQQEAEKIKKNSYAFDQLTYGQNPRSLILQTISNCDPELALDLFYKSRPSKISQMIAENAQGQSKISNGKYYIDNELQSEQRFIALAAEKNPERAIKLLRESLENGVSYETLNLLRKIYTKEPKIANDLAEEVVKKLLGETLTTNDYQTISTFQYFLTEFGREKNPEQKSLEISETSLRNLTDKISAFWLENNGYNYSIQTDGFKLIEKYFPARATRIKQKQVQTGNQEYDDYNKLVQSDASPEEMLKQAEKFSSYKHSIYNNALQKMAQKGNITEAINVINAKFSDNEADQQISNLYYNLASQETSKENYEQANNYINQIPNDQNRFNALINLARTVYQKDSEKNKQWSLSILQQAYGIIDTSEITQQEIINLIEIANVYAVSEPVQAFRTLELVIPAMNEFTRAYAVVSQFRNEPMQRNGEFLITNNGSMTGAYNLGNTLQLLKNSDFDRTIQLINSFDRSETRIALKLELIQSFARLPIGTRFSNYLIKSSR